MPENADALVELSLVEERFVSIPVDLLNVRVFDRGHAFTVQHLLDIQDALPHLLGSSRRDEPRDGLHGRVFFEDAGGLPWASRSMVPAVGSAVAPVMCASLR